MERYGRVKIKIKQLYPCFIAVINYGYSLWCYRIRDLIHTHPNSYPYFITAIKHGYICFISILTRPYLSNVLQCFISQIRYTCYKAGTLYLLKYQTVCQTYQTLSVVIHLMYLCQNPLQTNIMNELNIQTHN